MHDSHEPSQVSPPQAVTGPVQEVGLLSPQTQLQFVGSGVGIVPYASTVPNGRGVVAGVVMNESTRRSSKFSFILLIAVLLLQKWRVHVESAGMRDAKDGSASVSAATSAWQRSLVTAVPAVGGSRAFG